MSEEDERGTSEPETPLLRVINPDVTPEEVAALVAAFASLGSGEVTGPRRPPEWSAPRRMHRLPVHSGPGGWRSSGLPR